MRDQRSPAAGEEQEGSPPSWSEPPAPGAFVPWSRAFLRHAALWLMAAIMGGLVLAGVAGSLLHRLAGFFQIILISLFLSFAIEPAVDYLAKRGWRRGAATGLVFLAILVVAAGLIALMTPAVVTGTRQLMARCCPTWCTISPGTCGHWGIQVNQADIEQQVRTYGNRLLANAVPLLGGIVQVATGILSGVFQALAIALFTFYMVAQGPQMRRAVLFPVPARRAAADLVRLGTGDRADRRVLLLPAAAGGDQRRPDVRGAALAGCPVRGAPRHLRGDRLESIPIVGS